MSVIDTGNKVIVVLTRKEAYKVGNLLHYAARDNLNWVADDFGGICLLCGDQHNKKDHKKGAKDAGVCFELGKRLIETIDSEWG